MTEWQYIENLGLLEDRKCKHVLMDTLRAGYSPITVIYMNFVLNSLPPEEKKEPNLIDQGVAFSEKYFLSKKQKLFGERAQLSNKMMALPDEPLFDKERAKYSDLIQEKQRLIKELMQEGRMIEKGFAPIDAPAPGGEQPKSEADLLRKLASLRASRSRKRKQAETASGDDLKRINADIDQFNKQIEDVERAIENKTV